MIAGFTRVKSGISVDSRNRFLFDDAHVVVAADVRRLKFLLFVRGLNEKSEPAQGQ